MDYPHNGVYLEATLLVRPDEAIPSRQMRASTSDGAQESHFLRPHLLAFFAYGWRGDGCPHPNSWRWKVNEYVKRNVTFEAHTSRQNCRRMT
jgi:hypothetical protein